MIDGHSEVIRRQNMAARKGHIKVLGLIMTAVTYPKNFSILYDNFPNTTFIPPLDTRLLFKFCSERFKYN